ncbi:MAG: DUF4386 family protein [Gemmatimonadaceae bacterium]|nr:DUF4386 family protein [Gemmatimonadaceae bacterium]
MPPSTAFSVVTPHSITAAPSASVRGGRLAGLSLLLAAVGFIAVFTALAGSFDYPDILDQPAGEVLPRLLGLGARGRAIWALHAAIPLLLVPAAAGLSSVHDAVRHRHVVRMAAALAILSAFSMMLGLVRWPSVQWELARAWSAASAAERGTLTTLFDGANMMLGRFIGEFFGELFLNLAFVLFSVVAWSDRRLPRWVSAFGVSAGVIGLVAMWRNVTPAVSLVADVNNAILPAWLIVWGVALVRENRPAGQLHDSQRT